MMSDLEVVRLILGQIGELRVPIREEELRGAILNIAQNVNALAEAMEKRDREAAGNVRIDPNIPETADPDPVRTGANNTPEEEEAAGDV